MDRKVAGELLHVRDRLERAREIVDRGKDAYLRAGHRSEPHCRIQAAGLGRRENGPTPAGARRFWAANTSTGHNQQA